MKKTLLFLLCFSASAALLAQHQNIQISSDFNPNEPSICLDPKNPARLVAGANLSNVYFSSDTGRSWTSNLLSSTHGVWGDPVVSADNNGDFLFLHLSNPASGGSWIDRIVCQKSSDGGQTWSDGTYTGLNGAKNQDKHWIAIDPSTNRYYVTWTEFDAYDSQNPTDSTRILFSRSTDAGATWSAPQRINAVSGDCRDSDATVEGAVPCVGPNGELYVAWAGPAGLVFDRSLDKGTTWLNADIKIDNFPGGWDYTVGGLYRCNGLPVTACDRSNGPHKGTIYVNWTDQRNGPDDTDVWLSKSQDGGQTWSPATRVNNDPPGRQQFLTWMTVDQSNGWLWFVFYDRRQYPDDRTDVYMAVSRDGGQTFQNFKVSEEPFIPTTSQFMGDYNNICAHQNIVRPMWTRMDGVNTSVWTALVDTAFLNTTSTKGGNQDAAIDLQANYPNPAASDIWVPFKIRRTSKVTMQITNTESQVLHTVFENKTFEYGKYTEHVPLQQLHLPAGQYWIILSAEGKVIAKKMVVQP
ncbi:MAG: exo-alpha-sialidase [Saprospiraceae bacterium]|nr:exo-alpha-sialidase [Saprospiraceae bacterium]